MLKNGSYTTEAPTAETEDNYDSDTKYQLIEEVTSTSKTEPIVTEGYVNSNGILTFTGLAAGTYTITELVAPNGYNLLTTPITVDISAEYNTTATPVTCTWSATVNGSDATVDENGIIKFDVENKQGSQLPTTGGIGTTIFYVVGGLLVVVAGVLLIARKRASTEK